MCSCGNYLPEQVANVTCDDCTICGDISDLQDVYSTGNLGKYFYWQYKWNKNLIG